MLLMSISESNTPNKAYEQTIRLGRAQSCLHTVVETIGTDKEERELEKDLEADAFRFTNAWNSRGSAVRGAIIVGGGWQSETRRKERSANSVSVSPVRHALKDFSPNLQPLEPEQARILPLHAEHQGVFTEFERLEVERADKAGNEVSRVDRLAVDQGRQGLRKKVQEY